MADYIRHETQDEVPELQLAPGFFRQVIFSHIIEYKCSHCGEIVVLCHRGKPDRFVKCFDCQEKVDAKMPK